MTTLKSLPKTPIWMTFVSLILSQALLANTKQSFSVHRPSGELLYRGIETVQQQGGDLFKSTSYYDIQGKLVLEEEAILASEDLMLQLYRYDNKQNGSHTLAQMKGGVLEITYLAKEGETPQKGQLKWQAGYLHGKGFDRFIASNLTRLRQGKDLDFELVIPYRMTSMSFRIRLDGESLGKEGLLFLEPRNFFLRQIVPDMRFRYVNDNKGFLITSFTGPTGLLVDGKTEQVVEVRFAPPEPLDSKP